MTRLLSCLLIGWALVNSAVAADQPTRPNIVFLLADDLGYGDLGCYGQTKIRTPNIDRLAAEGMRFTDHYAGSNVCAPSRCVLMSGKHSGHAYIRDNLGGWSTQHEGQEPVPAGELQLPLTLKKLGYTLGGFGKWGLGYVGSSGDPLNQGFDRFFGYMCQAKAHNFYPTHLWDDNRKVELNNPAFASQQKLPADLDPQDPASYTAYVGKDYAPDLISEQALNFIRQNKDRPFFLYYPTTVPHLALQVPEDSLKEYEGAFPEKPYTGGRGYLPHLTPRAAYAAMITRMDREVGRMMALIHELGLDNRTIFIFTSDNGPLYNRLGGTDADFFNSAAGFRGRKGSFYEGGCRVPGIVRWSGHIQAGTTSDRVTGFEDWLPTLMELIGAADATPQGIDGISFAPTLSGRQQEPRPFLYREMPGYGGQQCVRVGEWKAVRTLLHLRPHDPAGSKPTFELFNLVEDPGETTDLAARYPDRAKQLAKIMRQQHVPSKLFPMRELDKNVAKEEGGSKPQDTQPAFESSAKPNIVFCLADDWGYGHAGVYGDKVVKTPTFDRLADQGALFTHAFCISPSCTPSRSAILTGQTIHRLDEGANLSGSLPARFAVYTDLLEEAGYVVGSSRKGWAPGNFKITGRKHNPAGPSFPDFKTFLDTVSKGRSFCYWFGSTDPHRPYDKGSGAASGMKIEDVEVPPYLPDTPEVRSDLLDYYFEVQRFDTEVGLILQQLEEAGLAANTIVVVTSDNGPPFPRAKANLYSAGTREPLAIRWPGKVKPGIKIDEFVNFADFAPTFLEAAGLPVPESMTGRTLLPLLTGKPDVDRDKVFLERERHAGVRAGNLSYPCRAIRTKKYLYIRNLRPDRWPAGDPDVEAVMGIYGDVDTSPTKEVLLAHQDEEPIARFFRLACAKRPAEELYDLVADPHELVNVADQPGYAAVKNQLRADLDDWMVKTADPRAGQDDDRWDYYPYYGLKPPPTKTRPE